jgi:hypothetical protein
MELKEDTMTTTAPEAAHEVVAGHVRYALAMAQPRTTRLSSKPLVTMCGVSSNRARDLYAGRKPFTAAELYALGAALGVNPGDFLRDPSERVSAKPLRAPVDAVTDYVRDSHRARELAETLAGTVWAHASDGAFVTQVVEELLIGNPTDAPHVRDRAAAAALVRLARAIKAEDRYRSPYELNRGHGITDMP